MRVYDREAGTWLERDAVDAREMLSRFSERYSLTEQAVSAVTSTVTKEPMPAAPPLKADRFAIARAKKAAKKAALSNGSAHAISTGEP